MKKGSSIISLSKKLLKQLKPFCKKVKITGSIRRKEKHPKDIDIVLIPKSEIHKTKIINFLKEKGKFLQGGSKKDYFIIKGIKVELYFTTEKSWGATLLAYSSERGPAIGLRTFARSKGFYLNQYGLFNAKTKKFIAGKTEKDIYKALGRKYKAPRER